MKRHNILLEITNGLWLIDESYAKSQFVFIDNILKGKAGILDKENAEPQFHSVDYSGAISFSAKGAIPFNNAAPQSTAVIFVSGPIMKYDNCGAPGTKTYTSLIQSAASNPNINSIVLVSDTPGGTVAGTEEFANAVDAANNQKPVVTLVDGLLASAGYWYASGSSEIYISNKTDQVGSIGTMSSFADIQAYYEKMGVKFHEIYADASKDKNADFNQARQGNYDLIKARLNAINDLFISHVVAGRGDKLNKKETLTGKVFMGQDAIDKGLVDGFKSLEQAVSRAQELAQSTNNNNQNHSKSMKIGAKFTAILTFLSSAFTGVKADETELTAEHLEKINSELETLATVKADLQTANADKVKLEGEKTKLEGEKTKLEGEKADLVKTNGEMDAEIQRLCKLNPGATSTFKKKTDDVGSAGESNDEFFCEADEQLAKARKEIYGK